jgi:hypothetical protein
VGIAADNHKRCALLIYAHIILPITVQFFCAHRAQETPTCFAAFHSSKDSSKKSNVANAQVAEVGKDSLDLQAWSGLGRAIL